MVKPATLFWAAVAAPLVASRTCSHGLRYCAKTLLEIGDYQKEIDAELKKWSPCTESTDNYMYYCHWGEIHLVGNCQTGCENNGMGGSDSCSPNFKQVVDCNLWYGRVANEWEKKGLRGN